MNRFKLLIDTNVVIGIEDSQPVRASLAELVRLSGEHAVGLFVDGTNYDDIARDKDPVRRAVTLSKLDKFQRLRDVQLLCDKQLIGRFGPINTEKRSSRCAPVGGARGKGSRFPRKSRHWPSSQSDRAGLGASVFTVEEALQWLKQTFAARSVSLPYVVERKAYEISLDHPILESLRDAYPGFDGWFNKCRSQHRDCWVLEIGDEIAGRIIRKTETHAEAGTLFAGTNILNLYL
jgi:hypothetical protein